MEKAFVKWLKGRLAEEDLTQRYVADILNVKQQAISYKMKHGAFSLGEAILILRKLKADDATILKIMR